MKAIVLEKPGDISVLQRPKPQPPANEALIKVRSLGVCGTDVNSYGGNSSIVRYPIIPGHEVAGEIVSIEEGDCGLKPGCRVIVDPYIYCGKCISCQNGQTNACEILRVLGVQTDGGMCEFIRHPALLLHPVPDNIPWEHVPLAEPLTVSLHALRRGSVKQGENVVIFGAGTIGLMAALAALVYGARPILLDVIESRLELAGNLGVDTVNVSSGDPVSAVSRLTNGQMAEVVIEASGSSGAISQVVDMAAYTGRVVLVGWPKHASTLDTAIITRKELTVLGSRNSTGKFSEALELLSSGKIDAGDIITKVVPFDELPEIIKLIHQSPADYLKVIATLG